MSIEEPRNYREIGRIARLQIQRKTLKDPLAPQPGGGRSPERYYDPAPILSGEMLWVADSVVAVPRGEEVIMDVHAAAHPHSRNRGNGNMLSIGFISHYDAMRDRFGDHLTDGVAGENILVETDERFTVDDVRQGLAVVTTESGILEFGEVTVAAPCVEFSRFCLGDRYADPKVTSDALRFLDEGMRGFYAYVAGGLPAMLKTGDMLCLRQ